MPCNTHTETTERKAINQQALARSPTVFFAAFILDAFSSEIKTKDDHASYRPSHKRRVEAREEFKRIAREDCLLWALLQAERGLRPDEPEEPIELSA